MKENGRRFEIGSGSMPIKIKVCVFFSTVGYFGLIEECISGLLRKFSPIRQLSKS